MKGEEELSAAENQLEKVRAKKPPNPFRKTNLPDKSSQK